MYFFILEIIIVCKLDISLKRPLLYFYDFTILMIAKFCIKEDVVTFIEANDGAGDILVLQRRGQLQMSAATHQPPVCQEYTQRYNLYTAAQAHVSEHKIY